MNPLTIICPNCKRTRKFLPLKANKENWSAQCFFCGKSFKIHPKKSISRVVSQ